jgi:hypothetical protein
VSASASIPPAAQARYQELLAQVSRYQAWLPLVKKNDRILNCGSAAGEPRKIRFPFECPNQWETLTLTPEAEVRHCEHCQRKVYFCDSSGAAEQRALAGDCLTVPQRVTASVGRELTRGVKGGPDVHQVWAEKLFGNDPTPAGGVPGGPNQRSDRAAALRAAAEQLGGLRQRFTPGCANLFAGIALGLLLIAGGLALASGAAWAATHPRVPAGKGDAPPALLWLAAAACLVLAGCGVGLLWWTIRGLARQQILVCQKGLVYDDGETLLIVRWKDISSVVVTETQEYFPLKGGEKYLAPMGKSKSYVVTLRGGGGFYFDGSTVSRPGRLATLIRDEIYAWGGRWHTDE